MIAVRRTASKDRGLRGHIWWVPSILMFAVSINAIFMFYTTRILTEHLPDKEIDNNLFAVNDHQVTSLPSDEHESEQPTTTARRRIAYTTLSYGNNWCPALTCALNIREVLDKYNTRRNHPDVVIDVIIMRLGKPIPSSYLPLNVTQRAVNTTRARGKYQWTHTYSKFWIATWYEYDAVVFLDSDVLLLQPLTELTDLAMSVPGSIITPRAYWLSSQQPFATSGTIVMSPLLESPFAREKKKRSSSATHELYPILDGTVGGKGDGEMDWLNSKHLFDKLSLVSGWFTLLCGEFYPEDKIYQYFGDELGLSPNETLNRAPLVHFVAKWKPWEHGIKGARGTTTPELRAIYDQWNSAEQKACGTGR